MPGAVLGTPQVVSHLFFRRCDSQWTGEKTEAGICSGPQSWNFSSSHSPQCQEEKQKEHDTFYVLMWNDIQYRA